MPGLSLLAEEPSVPTNIPITGVLTPEYMADPDFASIQLIQTNNIINAEAARTKYGYTGSGYSIAIIDSGVDYTHPALGGGFGQGYRVVAGYDFVNDDGDPMDDNGHGTHVAGIAAGNNSTYKGIVPDANIIALKVANSSGQGNFNDIESAFQWVIANRETYNIVSINLSMGSGNYTSLPSNQLEDEFTTLTSEGVFIAISSGNSFFSYSSQQGMGYPAISSSVVSVGATWDANVGGVSWGDGATDTTTDASRITSFSQRHSSTSIFAPGALLTAAYPGNSYGTLGGTSMAAPVVAGAAVMVHQALVDRGRDDLANQSRILQFFTDNGTTVIDGDDEDDNVTNTSLSFKQIDLEAAMDDVAATATPTPSASPTATPTPTPTPEPTATPTPTPTPEPSPTPTATPTPTPTPIPTATPTPTPVPAPPPPTTPKEVSDFMERLNEVIRQIAIRFEGEENQNVIDSLRDFQEAIKTALRESFSEFSRSTRRQMKQTRRVTVRIVRLNNKMYYKSSDTKAIRKKLRKQKRKATRLTTKIVGVLGNQ